MIHYAIINLVNKGNNKITELRTILDYATRGWHKLSRGDNPSYHTLTRFIVFFYYIEYPTQCHNYLV